MDRSQSQHGVHLLLSSCKSSVFGLNVAFCRLLLEAERLCTERLFTWPDETESNRGLVRGRGSTHAHIDILHHFPSYLELYHNYP